MRASAARRIALAGLVIWLIASAAFVLIHAAPGDAYSASLEDVRVSATARAQWRAQLGLDQPLGTQYVRWISNVARGNLGYSVSRARPVGQAIRETIVPSLLLSGTALVVGLLLGLGIGTWQAAHAGSRADRWVSRLTLTIGAIPDFWLALMSLLIVATTWHLVPTGGMRNVVFFDSLSWWGQLRDIAGHLVLPASTLAVGIAVRVMRYQRAAVSDALHRPFALAARARGLSARRVLWGHAARTAAGTAVTLTGLLLPGIVAGAIFVERIFSWPGMGRLTLDALGARDVPLVVGAVLVIGISVVLANACTDLLHRHLDPRLHTTP